MSIDLEKIATYLSQSGDEVIRLSPLGTGTNGTGYLCCVRSHDGTEKSYFLKALSPYGFGNEMPANRLERMIHGGIPYEHSIPVHAVFALDDKGNILQNLTAISEAIVLAELLPSDARNALEILRSPDLSVEEARSVASMMASAMADIHEAELYTKDNAAAVYDRSLRSIIHNEELTPGVWDFLSPQNPTWITSQDYSRLIQNMIAVREKNRGASHRLRRVQGDFWAANMYISQDDILITDSRTVWGEPGIDAAWMVGEFGMQSFIRTGAFRGDISRQAWAAIEEYQHRMGDQELTRYMALPYAFQAFAESVFTPNLTDDQRRTLFLAGNGGLLAHLSDQEFSILDADEYVERSIYEKRT